MVVQKFGQTWWGSRWLNALSQIDYSNRLPRGRSYANNGSVIDLKIENNAVSAKVKGSRKTPYSVGLVVPPLPETAAIDLLNDLAKDAVTVSKMLNGELDPKILEYAAKRDIHIFPQKWSDLKMYCSCPDWAVPCKHIAAVIYLISKEIDGDPFLVFSLHGIDLIEELRSRNIEIEKSASITIPALLEIIDPQHIKRQSLQNAGADQVSNGSSGKPNAATFRDLSYSQIPDLSQALISVLRPAPTFFERGDFKAAYARVIKRVARRARSILETSEIAKSGEEFQYHLKPQLIVDHNYLPTVKDVGEPTNLQQLYQKLVYLSEDDLYDLQPQTSALYHIAVTALQLLSQGAVIPEIFQNEDHYRLRWIPALLDPAVADLLAQLDSLLPKELIVFKLKKPNQLLNPKNQAIAGVSLFLDAIITNLCMETKENLTGDETFDLFFTTNRATFSKPGQGTIASGIAIWLSRFHITKSDYLPVLLLDETLQGFSLSLAITAPDQPLAKPVPLDKILTLKRWSETRFEILKSIDLLGEFLPSFSEYISLGAKDPIELSHSQIVSFLFDTLPVMRLLGIKAALPKALDRLLRPRLSGSITSQKDTASNFLTLDNLLQFSWKVAIGETLLTKEEFEKLIRSAQGIVKFKDQYVYLDPGEIDNLRKQLEKSPKYSGPELLRIALSDEFQGVPIGIDPQVASLIETLRKSEQIDPPTSIQAQLRPYQIRGYSWLYKNLRLGFGSIIADDMGLGKTLQVIATILKLKEEGGLETSKTLVVVPTSLLSNWFSEIQRFAPKLTAGIYHGPTRELPEEVPEITLTTYGVIRTDLEIFKKYKWKLVVADEAQNIKNPSASQTKSLKSIPAESFIAMSGTPVENRLSEYWSIMDFANRGFLGNLKTFIKEYSVPIEIDHDQQVAARFRNATSPFTLRRLKSDKSIIDDLPDKIEQNYLCQLTGSQAALYEAIVRVSLAKIQKESDDFSRQGLVLQMILTLKQICNHPAQYLKTDKPDPSESGKSQLLLDLLEPIYASHEKVLIFTQFKEMGDMLAEMIHRRFGHPPQFLHGGLTRKKRDAMVSSFQNDPTERAFILSLKAGGTGLNLTAASHVIHYDLWWNPAVEQQATDRAYRIGQTKNVEVFRLITQSTFEERINMMINSKRELAQLSVGIGEKWIGNLENQELQEIFALSS